MTSKGKMAHPSFDGRFESGGSFKPNRNLNLYQNDKFLGMQTTFINVSNSWESFPEKKIWIICILKPFHYCTVLRLKSSVDKSRSSQIPILRLRSRRYFPPSLLTVSGVNWPLTRVSAINTLCSTAMAASLPTSQLKIWNPYLTCALVLVSSFHWIGF